MGLQALDSLQSMMDEWSNQHGIIVARTNTVYDIAESKLEYTIGPGGDFDGSRPQEIVQAYFLDASGNQWPIKLQDAGWWNRLIIRNSTGRSNGLYYEPTFPLGTIRLEYAPYDPKIGFLTLDPLPVLTCLDDVIDLPPGYDKALTYNLAIEIAPYYLDSAPSSVVIAQADNTLRNIKRQNRPLVNLRVDSELLNNRGYYDVMNGPGYYPR